jgi:hypothetical protein
VRETMRAQHACSRWPGLLPCLALLACLLPLHGYSSAVHLSQNGLPERTSSTHRSSHSLALTVASGSAIGCARHLSLLFNTS